MFAQQLLPLPFYPQVSVDANQMSVGQMAFGQMAFGQMAFGHMVFGQMAWNSLQNPSLTKVETFW
jgi:hypothetical protein